MNYENDISFEKRAKECNLSPKSLYKLRHKKLLTETEIRHIVKNYRFSYNYDSDSQEQEESAEEGVPWNVVVSESEASDTEELKNEEKSVIQSVAESHVCDVCSKIFKNKYSLNLHKETIHMKIKKFVCDYQDCGRKFAQKNNMVKHKFTVHLSEKRFPCSDCRKEFVTTKSLKLHMRKHSKPIVVVADSQPKDLSKDRLIRPKELIKLGQVPDSSQFFKFAAE